MEKQFQQIFSQQGRKTSTNQFLGKCPENAKKIRNESEQLKDKYLTKEMHNKRGNFDLTGGRSQPSLFIIIFILNKTFHLFPDQK